MTDRKTTVHRSEHLRVDKFVSFIPMLIFIYLNSNNSFPTFPVYKKDRNEKVIPPPPTCTKFYIQSPLSLVVIFSYAPPPSNFPNTPLQVIIAQSLIDFEKAFDSLEWSFIEKTLNNYNFGSSLVAWIRLFYTDISSCVQNNGWTSDFFSLSRGARQGCPLCPYLFILCAEVIEIPSEMILGYKESKSLTLNAKYHNTLMIQLSSSMDLSPHFLNLYTS